MAVVGTDPYTVVQRVETVAYTAAYSGVADNNVTMTLGSPVAAAGRLLRASIVIDKLSGALTVSDGWTAIPGTYIQHGSGVSMASFYRIAQVNETPTITITWATAQGARAILWETNLDAAVLQGTPTATGVIDSTVTNTGTTLTEPAYVEAVAGIDSHGGKWTDGVGPTWSTGFTPTLYTDETTGAGGTGQAALSIATATYTTGQTPSATITAAGSDDQVLTVIAWSNQGAAPPEGPTLDTRWVGGLTHQGFAVTTKTLNVTSVRLRSGTTVSPPATVDMNGYATTEITGLSASTAHTYDLLSADDTVIGSGTVTTGPTPNLPGNFSFAFSSCVGTGLNPPIFTTIRDRNPLFFLQTGDFGYPDEHRTDQNNLSFYTDNYNSLQSMSHINNLLSNIPTNYIPDDHDGTDGNGSNATGEGRANLHTAYRQRVPHYNLPAANGSLYHTFVLGRVRIVVWDCRSDATPQTELDDANKSMLGAAQKQWFYDLIAAETLPLILVVSSVIWNEVQKDSVDTWGGYTTDRAEVSAAMQAAPCDFMILSGDAHFLAADDGTNSPGGFANVSAAPLDRPTSYKGGPWSHGTYESTSQYGWMDITDTGEEITASFTGISSDGVTRIAYSETYPAPSSPPPPNETTYGEFVLINNELIQVAETTVITENAVDLTQTEYDALTTKDPAVTYYITG